MPQLESVDRNHGEAPCPSWIGVLAGPKCLGSYLIGGPLHKTVELREVISSKFITPKSFDSIDWQTFLLDGLVQADQYTFKDFFDNDSPLVNCKGGMSVNER